MITRLLTEELKEAGILFLYQRHPREAAGAKQEWSGQMLLVGTTDTLGFRITTQEGHFPRQDQK